MFVILLGDAYGKADKRVERIAFFDRCPRLAMFIP